MRWRRCTTWNSQAPSPAEGRTSQKIPNTEVSIARQKCTNLKQHQETGSAQLQPANPLKLGNRVIGASLHEPGQLRAAAGAQSANARRHIKEEGTAPELLRTLMAAARPCTGANSAPAQSINHDPVCKALVPAALPLLRLGGLDGRRHQCLCPPISAGEPLEFKYGASSCKPANQLMITS